MAETLPGSFGEFVTVALTKSGDNLIYASDTDNILLAGTAAFAWSMTNVVELGRPAPSVTGDVTISEFRLWNSSVVLARLNRIARSRGLNGGAKNLFLNSEELDNVSWSKAGTTVSADVATNPYGRATADKVIASASAGQHKLGLSHTFRRSVPYVFSVAAKADGYDYLGLLCNGEGVYFDIASGAVLGTFVKAPYDAVIESMGSGWYRCSLIVVPSLGGANLADVYVSSNGTGFSFTGNGTGGVIIGGMQLADNAAAPITYHRRLGA